MKLEKLLDDPVLTGAIIGIVVGLYFPFDAYKLLLVLLAVVMGLRLVSAKGK